MKDIIFTDFFDTIMFRHVHPFQVRDQWCKIIGRMFGISANEIKKISRQENQDSYLDIYSQVYSSFSEINKNCSLADFVDYALRVEESVEIGCQYLNRAYWKKLRQWKAEGKRIVIVSDFHLPSDSFKNFLTAKNIDESFFSGIYISCDCKCSKAKGNLYGYVLNDFGCSADEVCMIGDNSFSDGRQAKVNGIESIVTHNYIPKLKSQITRRFSIDYSSQAFKKIRREAYHSPFSEYALLFSLFTRTLYGRLKDRGERSVSFLAREGYYLKCLFDDYQKLLVDGAERIESKYLKCSRRAAKSVSHGHLQSLLTNDISLHDYLMSLGYTKEEIEKLSNKYELHSERLAQLTKDRCHDNVVAARTYMSQYIVDGHLNIVDIGWMGSMQEAITSILNVPINGYYLGLNNSPFDNSNREGLLFEYNGENRTESRYANILRANIQLYEELTAAPHGSALSYRLDDEGRAYVTEDWAENERQMYETVIERKQKELRLICQSLDVWCFNQDFEDMLRVCAKTVLRSALIADDERLLFLESLDKGFINNIGKQTQGLKYDKKSVKIGFDLIYAPDRYTRYLAKVQRSLKSRAKILQRIYLPVAWGG